MVYLLPLVVILIWSGNGIVNKLAAATIEPSAMSFYRWLLAFVILTPFCLGMVLKQRAKIKPYLLKISVLALLGMVLNQSLGYFAGLTTSASNMSLITSLVPLMSVFLSKPLLGKPISALSVLGGVLSLLGLAYMLGRGDLLFIFHSSISQGDGLMLLAALVYAIYCVLLKRWQMPFGTWTLIYLQICVAIVLLAPLWLTSQHLLPPSSALPLIAYAAIGASVFSPWLWLKAIGDIGAETTTMFMNLLPVFTLLLAALLLGETMTIYHLVGGVLVIGGVILSQIKPSKPLAALETPPRCS